MSAFRFEFRGARGRKISEHQWLRNLERGVQQVGRDGLRKNVEKVVCPIHGQAATAIRVSAANPVRLEWDACCKDLSDAIHRLIGTTPPLDPV